MTQLDFFPAAEAPMTHLAAFSGSKGTLAWN